MGSTSHTDAEASAWPPGLLGRHYLAEFGACPPSLIGTVEAVEGPFLDALDACGARILGHRVHQFEPAGATVVVLLAESHASLHTWPEKSAVCVDFFTCSESMDVSLAIAMLEKAFGAGHVAVRTVNREVPL